MGNNESEKSRTRAPTDSSVVIELASGTVTTLEKRFSLWSAVGILFSVTNTPVILGTFLSTVIGVGGSPVFVWGYFIGFTMNMCICVSLAEIAAVYPHASGQSVLPVDTFAIHC
jgi:amino acid transporter